MRDVLLVCPNDRDREAIGAAGLASRYRVRELGADLDAGPATDVGSLLKRADLLPADGVVATKDRSALLASLICRRRGLPGPTPQALINCQYKPISRAIQRAVAPASTPRVALVDDGVPFPPPLFVKPVVGRLSQNARRVDDPLELLFLPEGDAYAAAYAEIAGLAGLDPAATRGYLAEELLAGAEVTLEGYVHGGEVVVLGLTDSVKYRGTNSFERFEYPSALPVERQLEAGEIVTRLLPALSFDEGFFNVELFVPDSGPVGLIEVNGRLASQFDPLYRAVHGRSNYEAAFALACGDDPGWHELSAHGVAISYCLRVFADARVESIPAPEPGLEILCRPGQLLSENGMNDAASYRLCIFSCWGPTRAEAVERCRERAASLRRQLRLRPAVPAAVG